MATVNITQDFQRLPVELQRQVEDYVAFLLERYGQKPAEKAETEEDWFWRMIGLLDFSQDTNLKITEPLVSHLVKQKDEKIFLFDDILSDHLRALDAPKYFAVASKGIAGTTDMFLYARCEVVACGKDFYTKVLHDPSHFLADGDLEQLLSVANRAYEQKNKKEYPHTPRSIYETMWNKDTWGEKAISFA